MRRATRLLGVAILLSLGGSAQAVAAPVLVYDNGPETGGGNEFSTWIQAEDFVLPVSTRLTGVTFWAEGEYFGSITWMVFSTHRRPSGEEEPSVDVLASGTVGATLVPLGVRNYPVFRVEVPIGPFTADAGVRYWLGLHNGPLRYDPPVSQVPQFWWLGTDRNSTVVGYEYEGSPNEPDAFTPLYQDSWGYSGGGLEEGASEHAFRLYGERVVVAEPSSTMLVVLAGLAAFARRRQRG